MRAVFTAWDKFWLRPEPPAALALFRIAFYTAVLLVYLPLDDRPWTHLSPVFWAPVSVFHFLPPFWRNAAMIGWIQIFWKLSLAAAAAGLLTRISTAVAAFFGIFLLGLPDNFGKIDHLDGIIAIILCILCVSRCADDLALDSRSGSGASPDAEYGWPLRLVRALFVLVFFSAGVAKLRISGLAWMSSDNLRYLLLSHAYMFHMAPTNLGLWIARFPRACHAAAILTVALEISMPLAFLVERLRYPLILASLLMQTMIALAMGVYFTPYLAAYLAFLPWESWARTLIRDQKLMPSSRMAFTQ